MELATITMPGETLQDRMNTARKAFLEYRAAVKERHDKEDQQIMRGYKALSQGKQLIHLTDTIRAGGVDEKGLPRLAVVRADFRWCHVTTWRDGSLEFSGHEGWSRRTAGDVRLPAATLSGLTSWGARAIVPIVPPGLRPTIAMSNFHILWEAEWQRVAPKDPALLRHLGGDLYAVVAVWDLTELERAVLGGRFSE